MPSPSSRDTDTYQYGPWLFPTVRIVEYLHDHVALKPGELPGYKHGGAGRLEAALQAPIDGWGDADAYPTFFQKVAVLGFRVCHDHCFEDANKRTAMLTVVLTLEANGQ